MENTHLFICDQIKNQRRMLYIPLGGKGILSEDNLLKTK